jgi:hypothetical protein
MALGPIDYYGMQPHYDLAKEFGEAAQLGLGFRQVLDQRASQQASQERAAQYQADVSAFMQTPTPEAAAKLALAYPEHAEPVTKAWGSLNAEQQKRELQDTYTIASTLHADRPDLALQQIDQRREAMKNSGQSTAELDALRDVVEKDPKAAYAHTLTIAARLPGGDAILKNLQSINKDARDGAESEVTVAGKQADNASKLDAVVSSTFGSLVGKNAKPAQVKTAIGSLFARKVIGAERRAELEANIPEDPKLIDRYLKQVQASGMKPDDQMKYTTPDANTVANNERIAAEGAANRAKDIKVTQMVSDREANSGDDAASFTKEAIDNAAARYNIDGTLPPMGMGKAAAAGRTKILNRAAELKAGISGEQQRRDQLTNKGDIASQNKAVREFTSGKLGASVRSFNVGLAHLDTLGQLADAMSNKDTQAINRVGNYFATQTGAEAPVKFEAAKKVVTDEIVKAIVGAGGTGHDREEAAKTVSAASSPAQLRGVINTYKELMVGQLGGLEQQYRTGSGRDDFHKFLSPQAQALYGKHSAAPVPSGPAVGTVDGGFRFKGGDPAQKSNWERL